MTGSASITVTVNESLPQGQVGVNDLVTGRYETTGRRKNKVTTFLETAEFSRGDGVVIGGHRDCWTGDTQPEHGAQRRRRLG
jgi:hypothetical protein